MKIINFSPHFKVSSLAAIIGLVSGVVSLGFNYILSNSFVFMEVIYQTPLFIWIAPFVTAVIIGLMRHNFLHDENQGFGVAQVMYEIENIRQLMMKPFDVFIKMIGTFLTLIAGFSVGRQGPIVHLGGAIGSNIAYLSNLEEDEIRVLIGCGVAGCLAGVFNSPIFATLFVVEILFKKRYFDMIATILLSAVVSTAIVRLFNDQPIFDFFKINYHYNHSEILLFVLLGIFVAFISIIYVIALRYAKYGFSKLKVPQMIKNLIGAFCISLALSLVPHLFHYNFTINEFFIETYTTSQLFAIVSLFILLTAISLGSGAFGGIFAPGLFIGFVSGLAIANILAVYFVIDIKTYALAGMAAMYAGFAIAPLSAAIMVVELTGQYNLLFPILISTLIASKTSESLIGESIYHQNLKDLLND